MVFTPFATAVRAQTEKLFANDRLFLLKTGNIFERYLAAFPEGTNPIFRKRAEFDCSCCKHFIRALGSVVAINNGCRTSVWDVYNELPTPFRDVAFKMSEYLLTCEVEGLFLTPYPKAGQETSFEPATNITWEHFAAIIPGKFISKDPGTKISAVKADFDVFKRGVLELKPEAVATVLQLIRDNELYKGSEYLSMVAGFQTLQNKAKSDEMFWELCHVHGARVRNSAIGTLLINLSEGMDEEGAIKAFETTVAPQNYKRPTSAITPRMIEAATKTIVELGLEEALERRHAKMSDVSINSVLWVDGSAKGRLKGGIADLLMEEVKPATFDPKGAKPISIDEFLKLPHPKGIRLYIDNGMSGNFVSVTAPVHPEVKQLFKWDNDFAWSYEGNYTDSIKERVKKAGGKVEGVNLRCSLAWSNYDDLDLHCFCPDGHVYFGDRMGTLDVDANGGTATTREPVENMRWVRPQFGNYAFSVHNFAKRETLNTGFVVELETALGLHTFRYDKAVKHKESIDVCTVAVQNGQVVMITPSDEVEAGELSKTVWGVKTLDLVKVNAIILSPNHWDKANGNKHHFFILEGCKNPEPVRGIYNEFLHPRLDVHRKVFEVLGAKTKCPVAEDQLSGVGFSSTRKDRVIAVSGNTAYAIQFGEAE